MNGTISMAGNLLVKKVSPQKAPLSWRIRNALRTPYWTGWLNVQLAHLFSHLTGIPTLTGQLRLVLTRTDGTRVDYGVVSYRSITTAFVNYVTDQLQTETSTFGDFKYHDSGVGTTAENVANTDIETTDGESRVAGTQTETSANVYSSVATITYTSTKAITEHGLFNASTAGTLMDRSVFSAVNVVNTEQIQFSYALTISSGG